MRDNLEYYLTLILSELSLGKQKHILSTFDDLDELSRIDNYNGKITKLISAKEFDTLRDIINNNSVRHHLEGVKQNGMGIISIDSEYYPETLRNINEPPLILYYRGDITLLKSDCIAIVGSRVCTRYGREQTAHFAKELSKASFTIVSGLADGIDTHAHRGTLDANGKTIAVLAGGLNTIYPAINADLAREIVQKGGLLISENVPTFLPKGYAFVQRNRIIAGISMGVFVPEMGLKSGAMHTLNYANEEGRMIFALPGNVNSSSSLGTNNLIKTLQGACVTEPADIIRNYPEHQIKVIKEITANYKQLDFYENIIMDALKIEETHFDELLDKTKLEAKKLLGILTTMEIRGLIKKVAGNCYTI